MLTAIIKDSDCDECFAVKNSLIELYLNVKVKNDFSDDESSDDASKTKLSNRSNLDLIQYIQSSFEILLELQADQLKSESKKRSKMPTNLEDCESLL